MLELCLHCANYGSSKDPNDYGEEEKPIHNCKKGITEKELRLESNCFVWDGWG